MKNGVAGFVNQVSSFFTGEEVMEKEKGYKFDYEEGNMEMCIRDSGFKGTGRSL